MNDKFTITDYPLPEDKVLMYFPQDDHYFEILGHRIEIDGKGYDGFLEHLNKLATYEEENKKLKASVKYYVDILTDLKKWLEEDEEKSTISFAAGKHFNYKDVLNKIKELEERHIG